MHLDQQETDLTIKENMIDMIWAAKNSNKENGDQPTSPFAGMPDNSKVELVNNRIYYYAGISDDNILSFNKHIQSLVVKAKIHSATHELPVQQSGSAFVHIQSFGGSVFSGLSGMDTILEARESIPVTTLIDGCAASAATFLSIVGTRRLMRGNSYMLIHQLSSGVWGKYDSIKDEVENLDLFMGTIRDMYEEYTKVPKSQIDKILKRDMWWDAATCLKYGMVDEII